ncbi:MAG: ABC transporter substrate-binding protein [Proteobacteria bacterium]|nr:ABC transporter substrate-binding protein [Pseudomonadota bacterium]
MGASGCSNERSIEPTTRLAWRPRGPRSRLARPALLLLFAGCDRPLRPPAAPTRSSSPTLAQPADDRLAAGLAAARQSDYAHARLWLGPWGDPGHAPPHVGALTALAQAEEATGANLDAARHWSRLHALGRDEGERAYAARRVAQLVAERLRSDQLALLARGSSAPANDLARLLAQQRLREQATAPTPPQPLGAQPPVIGVLLSTEGPYRAIAALAVTGAMAALGQAASASLAEVELVLRPLGRDPAAAVEALVRAEPLVALIGACDPTAAVSVAEAARRHGLPWLSLAPALAGGADPTTLRLLPDNAARARALADHAALARPRGSVAVLAPESPFGHEVAQAFVARAVIRGLRPLRVLFYPPATVGFKALATTLAALAPGIVLLADSAPRLALIAPALALAGLGPAASTAAAGQAPAGARTLLLATADGVDAAQLRRSARYLSGAVLAPGFYPASREPATTTLIARYTAQQGQAPRLVDALTHDAVIAVRLRLAAGARTGPALIQALHQRPSQQQQQQRPRSRARSSSRPTVSAATRPRFTSCGAMAPCPAARRRPHRRRAPAGPAPRRGSDRCWPRSRPRAAAASGRRRPARDHAGPSCFPRPPPAGPRARRYPTACSAHRD